jgi:hypothetical protein
MLMDYSGCAPVRTVSYLAIRIIGKVRFKPRKNRDTEKIEIQKKSGYTKNRDTENISYTKKNGQSSLATARTSKNSF